MHPLAHNSVRTESAPQHCCLPDHLRSEEQIRLIEIVLQRSWILLATAEPPAANGTTWWNSRNPRSVHLPRAPMNAQRPSSRRQTSRLTAAGTCRDAGAPARGSRGRDVEAHFCFSKCSISADNARSNTTATSPVGTGRYLATGTGDCGRVSLILHGRVPLSVVGRRRPNAAETCDPRPTVRRACGAVPYQTRGTEALEDPGKDRAMGFHVDQQPGSRNR
jgi:hypothetical protein